MARQVFDQLLWTYHWEIQLVAAHGVLHRRIDPAAGPQLLELNRAQIHLSSFDHVLLVLDHVHSRGMVTCYVRAAVFEPDSGQLEAECNRKADHVACDHEAPDDGHVISDQCLGLVTCGCARVVSEPDRAFSSLDYDPVGLDNVRAQSGEEFAHVALDSSHIVSEKGACHVLSDTSHAPSERDFGHVLYDKKPDLEWDLVPDFDRKFSDPDFDHLAFDNYQATLDTDCAGLDQHQDKAAVYNDLFCSLEEEVSGSGRAVFPTARVARKEYDTVRAPQHDHMGSASECHWLEFRRLSNERDLGYHLLVLTQAEHQTLEYEFC